MTTEERERAYRALRLMEWSQEAVNNFFLYVETGDDARLKDIENTAPVPEEWL